MKFLQIGFHKRIRPMIYRDVGESQPHEHLDDVQVEAERREKIDRSQLKIVTDGDLKSLATDISNGSLDDPSDPYVGEGSGERASPTFEASIESLDDV